MITEQRDGETLIYGIADEFSFDLDAAEYPPSSLDRSECRVIQPLKRLAPNGPDRYPIGFVVNKRGKCTIRNGSFDVKIDVCIQATDGSKTVCRLTDYNEPP